MGLVVVGGKLFLRLDTDVTALLVAISLLLAHWLIWQKAVASGWRLLRASNTEPNKFTGLATVWFIALVLFQLCFLGVMLLALAFGLSGPMVF